MVRFTDGLFRSATHRVAKPPGEQNNHERWSVVYFERPNDDVRMGPLVGENKGVAEDYPTTKEWIERRVLGGKIAHYKGEQEYIKGRGTEAGLELEK
jgi:isopenicillin N synthase-like dioxygenase